MIKRLTGNCLCGAVSYCVTGELEDFLLYHCSRCQKSSGSAHTSNVLVRSATCTWEQGEAKVTSFELSGALYSRCFCSLCGSPLPAYEDDLLIVPASSIRGGIGIAPRAHIYSASKAVWEHDFESLEAFEELPG